MTTPSALLFVAGRTALIGDERAGRLLQLEIHRVYLPAD
ncbi:hypothetical protein B194_5095 [Serratia plymuthica A30]|nr:hypothetical protein B194_5095 [Serratia plymuthica A30]